MKCDNCHGEGCILDEEDLEVMEYASQDEGRIEIFIEHLGSKYDKKLEEGWRKGENVDWKDYLPLCHVCNGTGKT